MLGAPPMNPPFSSKDTALVAPNRWLLPALFGLAGLGLVGMIVSIATPFFALAGVSPVLLALGLVGALVAYRRSPWPRDLPAEVHADDAGVRVGERLLLKRSEIKDGFFIPDLHHGPRVQLTRRLRSPRSIRVRDEAEGRALLRALGLDASQVAVSFPAPSRLLSEQKLSIPFGIVLALLFIGLGAGTRVLGLGHQPVQLPLMLVVGLLFVVLQTKLTVGADGVLRTWFWRKNFWSWADVKQIQTYVDSSFWSSNNRWRGVELVLRSGASVRFPIVQGRSLDTGQLTLILERMRQAKESHDRGDASSEAALLERHERDIPGWIAALRAIGSGANQDHRTAPVVPEKLWRIVEDPAATAAARAGAAVALSAAIDEGGKKRLAAAAEAVAAPKLRVALDAAAKGDEEALREALSEVETGERVKRA
jgi:hypothetical protein